ncbi:MAG: prepilin-type N-terminal cleavage/methylation domain-containing protein [Phycisphaerae bacterium]|nr:prepilin-type N-terminal cleavage/methylation domain-containing protein [Phycisphaerae bacterium]
MRHRRLSGFTLVELLVVIGIIAIVVGIVLPAFSRARERSKSLACLSRVRELGRGWESYLADNEDNCPPGRMFNQEPKGPTNPANWYDVGNGLKYRPRWPAVLGPHVGVFAFNRPEPPPWKNEGSGEPNYERQDYDNELYQCPVVRERIDERNYAFGYNYQFLGNARMANDQFINFPVRRNLIAAPSSTVVIADAMGTAAEFSDAERASYENDGTNPKARGNHGWSLDPPRLTDRSDRGTGDEGSPRTAVDPRHNGQVNVVFADGHTLGMTDYEMGYRRERTGEYVNRLGEGSSGRPLQNTPTGTDADFATNKYFSGNGRDVDPPVVPGK